MSYRDTINFLYYMEGMTNVLANFYYISAADSQPPGCELIPGYNKIAIPLDSIKLNRHIVHRLCDAMGGGNPFHPFYFALSSAPSFTVLKVIFQISTINPFYIPRNDNIFKSMTLLFKSTSTLLFNSTSMGDEYTCSLVLTYGNSENLNDDDWRESPFINYCLVNDFVTIKKISVEFQRLWREVNAAMRLIKRSMS